MNEPSPAGPEPAPRAGPPYDTSRAALERDSRVEFVRGSGPGGQHRNKVETGVRLTHAPSGVVVVATSERSQHRNREQAFERLAAKLAEQNRVPKTRKQTRKPRSAERKRLDAKRKRSERKRERRRPPGDG